MCKSFVENSYAQLVFTCMVAILLQTFKVAINLIITYVVIYIPTPHKETEAQIR